MIDSLIVLILIKLSSLMLYVIARIHSVAICLAKLRNKVLHKAVKFSENQRGVKG